MSNESERSRAPRFVSAELTDSQIRVHAVRVSNELNGLWEAQVVLQVDQDIPLDAGAVLEAPAALYWESADGLIEAPFYGVVREVEMLEVVPGYWMHYRVTLVPSLWFSTQTHRSRVFVDASVPDVVDAVLADAGLSTGTDYQWSLADRGAYPERAMIVQYQESDFDFLARLLEHEGIFFYAHADAEHEVWVLGDGNDAFASHPSPITFSVYNASEDTLDQRFHTLRDRHASIPSHVVTRDYSDPIPRVSLQNEHEVTAAGIGLVFLTDDHLRDDRDASRLGRIRAEELAVSQRVFQARGNAQGLRAGAWIELSGHPVGDLEGEYVVVSVELEQHADDASEIPEVTVELIRRDVPYHPPRLTRRPRIDGVVVGHVDGETVGIPAPIDERGRYRVLLPHDSANAAGGRASCWVRMAQTFSGPGYGMHFPLHVGTEVLLAHVDGDPDRPLIVGSVPNPDTATTVTNENATASIIRSKAGIVHEYEDDARVE